MPHLHTLNIGHAIISRAVLVGLSEAIVEMLALMRSSRAVAKRGLKAAGMHL